MKTIHQMRALRDLTASLPEKVNILWPDTIQLGYARFFLHERDGYGYYPRFKDWEDVADRVKAFRGSIAEIEGTWRDFLSEWAHVTGCTSLVTELTQKLSKLNDTDLYEKLLYVALNTPASWGDRIIWQAFVGMPPTAGCVVVWQKCDHDNHWRADVLHEVDSELKVTGSGTVENGALLDGLAPFASILWEYLYPMVQRENFHPPQNPAKYSSGRIVEVVIPLGLDAEKPLGWITAHLSGDEATALRAARSTGVPDLLATFAKSATAILHDHPS